MANKENRFKGNVSNPRHAEAVSACLRKAGAMHHKTAPRGGAKNDQPEFMMDLEMPMPPMSLSGMGPFPKISVLDETSGLTYVWYGGSVIFLMQCVQRTVDTFTSSDYIDNRELVSETIGEWIRENKESRARAILSKSDEPVTD